ncbi:MAG: radical SAM protein [Nannocystaceae bacterium]|nr:B12-binding domain-containing radical SAM protein [Myxococcales bacterium]
MADPARASRARARLRVLGGARARDPADALADPLRVCLIHLPTITAPRSLSYYDATPPLGLAYLAASTRAAGYEVDVIDATGEGFGRLHRRATGVGDVLVQGLSIAEITARIDEGVAVVGVSNMFLHQWPLLRELIAAIRARLPAVTIVAGGENATALWEHMLGESPGLDVCVLGEGERTFTSLLAALAAGAPLSSVPSIAYRDGARATRTPAGPRIDDLDAIPPPAWELFPVAAYLDQGHGSGVARGRSLPLLTSRGCPYRCTFCSSPAMWTTRYLRRDPERVVDEIAAYVRRYQITNVDLNDLTAMLTKDWILEFCAAMQRRGLGVSWQLPSGTRSEAVDREAAEALHAAGCRNFCYAPESGSEATLSRIKKRVKLPRLRSSLQDALAAGLTTHASIIIGFPHERGRDLWATYRFVLRMAVDGLHTVAVMVFAPYPGSEEYAALREQGRLTLDEAYYYSSLLRASSGLRSYNPRIGSRRLFAIQLGLLVSFFAVQYTLRPWRLGRVAWNLARGRHESVMDQFLATKLRHLKADLRTRARELRARLGGSRATGAASR